MIDFDARIENTPPFWTNDRLHFFKYASIETAKAVLKNRTLRWSTRATLNDPFEFVFNLDVPADKDAIRTEALEKMWTLYSGNEPIKSVNGMGVALEFLRVMAPGIPKEKMIADFTEPFNEGLANLEKAAGESKASLIEMFDRHKVLCLSVRPDIMSMWTHYSENHTSIVFRFRNIVPTSPYGLAKPVYYSEEIPAFFPASYLVNSICGLETMTADVMMDRIVYRKSLDWSTEQEWRIDGGNGRNRDAPHEDVRFAAEELDGIIFGAKTSDANKDIFRDLAKAYPNVEFMQATISAELGKMDINVIA